MDPVLLKINLLHKRDYSDMEILFLELLILMMELFIKALYKMDKSLVKEYFKDLTDSIIKDTLGMISLMELVKFIM